MAAAIGERLPGVAVELIDGGRGDFIVCVDGEQIWNKKGADGGFPNEAELVARLASHRA